MRRGVLTVVAEACSVTTCSGFSAPGTSIFAWMGQRMNSTASESW